MKLDHEWFEQKIEAFMQIGDWRIHFKAKVTLIFCVFSSSDVRSNWRLLYSLLHPTTKHLNHLIWDIFSSPAPEWHNGGWTVYCLLAQYTQPCQSTIVGAVCTGLRHSDRNLRTDWFEKGDFKTGIKKTKQTGWIIVGWLCTHTSNTHLCSNKL